MTLAVTLDRIESKLGAIEKHTKEDGREIRTTLTDLTARVTTQNHRLDKIEWTQEKAAITAMEKEKADERTWANARWLAGFAFMAAGVTSGIVFGIISLI